MTPLQDFALVGLGVMGRNLALNLAGHGIHLAVHDQDPGAVARCVDAVAAVGPAATGHATLASLVAALKRPRRLLLMVNAGAPVDAVLDGLRPLLEPGDIVVDGGNSHWPDTERRAAAWAAHGLHFVGAGISGGEEGARTGPAIMPGGSAEAWAALRPVFEAIAAKVDGEPCVSHIGPGGAGHFVKMVHNGIEYADMQLIGEAYALLQAAGLDADAMAAVFRRWNTGVLQSYLIEITGLILATRDPETDAPIVDVIQDRAGQKGTGRWTLVAGAEQGVPIGTMTAAVDARLLSALKDARVAASTRLAGPPGRITGVEPAAWADQVAQALYASKIVAYAQGLALLQAASQDKGWGLDLAAIARLWRGGCIIRARFLGRVAAAGAGAADLLQVPYFVDALAGAQAAWRGVVATAVQAGVPLPAMGAALAHHDMARSARLPANLLQAQRDFFGAHTYERTDRPAGQAFHTAWPPTAG
ncbi:MAG: NADP-dependent phosphogluconate dehydrogenase [Burkholderiaceae bacterium]|nr:NADP-dependent phosphogluconate dehydrogenase [Burkholderiaceae bacterium]